MGLEVEDPGISRDDLNPAWPLDDDPVEEGAQHMRMIKQALKNLNVGGGGGVAIGDIIQSGRSADTMFAANYVPASGQELDRTTYATLFAEYDVTWGAGDGSTTFNVPDVNSGMMPVSAEDWTVGTLDSAFTMRDNVALSPYDGTVAGSYDINRAVEYLLYNTTLPVSTTYDTTTTYYQGLFYTDDNVLHVMYRTSTSSSSVTRHKTLNGTTWETQSTTIEFYNIGGTKDSANSPRFFALSSGMYAISLNKLYKYNPNNDRFEEFEASIGINQATSFRNISCFPDADTCAIATNGNIYKLKVDDITGAVTVTDLGAAPGDISSLSKVAYSPLEEKVYYSAGGTGNLIYERADGDLAFSVMPVQPTLSGSGSNAFVIYVDPTNGVLYAKVFNGTELASIAVGGATPKVLSWIKAS